jgi:hypothetical protein
MREDSTWSRLSIEQRQLLESWLFDGNLGYAETLARVKSEFGVEATIPSVGRYYRRRARERQTEELVIANREAIGLNSLPVSIADLREAAVKLAGKEALKLAGEKPHEPGHLMAFTRVLLESEENDLRRAKLKLAQQQFDYEMATALIDELPRLRSYLITVGHDDSLSHEEKMKRTHSILFGMDDPKAILKGKYTTSFTGRPPEEPAAGVPPDPPSSDFGAASGHQPNEEA